MLRSLSTRGLIRAIARSAVATPAMRQSLARPSLALGLVQPTNVVVRRGFSTPVTESATQAFLNQDAYKEIQRVVTSDPRPAVHFSEFKEVCGKLGLNAAEARDAARTLHRAGLVFFVEQGILPQTNDVLLLQPQRVREVVDHVLAMQALTAQNVTEYTASMRKELERLRAEYVSLHELKLLCDNRARRHADRVIVAALGFLVGQWAVFLRLVWWELSWDVMEPISYMLSLTMNIIALVYFLGTRNEYTYDALRARAIEKRAHKEYIKAGFSLVKYEEVIRAIAETESNLSKIEALPFTHLPVAVQQPAKVEDSVKSAESTPKKE